MVLLDDVINKYFNKDNMKHAYLLETNDYTKVLSIAKRILLDFNTEVENLEILLDNGTYSDLRLIKPDGQWIKKEQVSNLKDEFKVKSSFNNKRIYIIKNAENLNKAAANTMLKFLEEPEDNIIALLVTANKTKVLETIVSRCQYIILDSNREKQNYYGAASINLYNILENKKQIAGFDLIKILESYDDRNEIKSLFNEVILIYEQILLKKLNVDVDITYDNLFDKTLKNNTIDDIRRRINGLILIVDSMEYNVNLKLLMDKLVISMFGVD